MLGKPKEFPEFEFDGFFTVTFRRSPQDDQQVTPQVIAMLEACITPLSRVAMLAGIMGGAE